jgi:cadmium resistance protein CadD (predicted permease)
VRHILSLAAATETDLLLLLFLVFLFFPNKRNNQNRPVIFIYFCLFLSFSVLITIGYSVNNIGAIVRYRSIILPLLLTPVFCQINWQRINKLISNNISTKNNFTKTDHS